MRRITGIALLGVVAGLFMVGTLCWAAAGDERFLGGGFDGGSMATKTAVRIVDAIPFGSVFSVR